LHLNQTTRRSIAEASADTLRAEGDRPLSGAVPGDGVSQLKDEVTVPSVEPGQDAPEISRRALCVGATLILVASFVFHYSLSQVFERTGVYADQNVLFQADPLWRMRSFSSGHGWSDRNLLHPNLGNYFSIPNHVLSKAAVASGLYQGSKEQLRLELALLVGPLFGAATVATVFVLLSRLGFSLSHAALLTVATQASFSQMVFGSIPDHFVIGGFCIAAGTLLAAELTRDGGRPRWLSWNALGILTLGITSANIVWLGTYFSLPHLYLRRNWRLYAKHVVLWALLVLTVTFGIAEFGRHLYGQAAPSWSFPEAERYDEDIDSHGLQRLVQVPTALANTFCPPRLGTTGLDKPQMAPQRRQYRFTVEGRTGWAAVIIVNALLLLGTAGWLSQGGPFRILASACLIVLVGNLVVTSYFGNEFFVFSQHWIVPAIVLMAGVLRFPQISRRPLCWTLFIVTALMAVHNLLLLKDLHATLLSYPHWGPDAVP